MLKNFELDDKFWELDLMECNDKWALDKECRKHISALDHYTRAAEEVEILKDEIARYVDWHGRRIKTVRKLMDAAPENSRIQRLFRLVGENSFSALNSLQTLKCAGELYKDLERHEFNEVLCSLDGNAGINVLTTESHLKAKEFSNGWVRPVPEDPADRSEETVELFLGVDIELAVEELDQEEEIEQMINEEEADETNLD